MSKPAKNLIYTAFIALLVAVIYAFQSWLHGHLHSGYFAFEPYLGYLRSFIVLFWLISISYKVLWKSSWIKGIVGWLVFLSVAFGAFILIDCFFATTEASIALYKDLKKPALGWKGRVFQADDRLGFKPIPNARGFHTFPDGREIPMKYDAYGFRVPVNVERTDTSRRPKILFLGCSFTYGHSVAAEQTFPFITADSLQGVAINAGVSAYGLAHMYLLSDSLIRTFRPQIVVVQYSPWLAFRAASYFMPIYYGRLTAPYFVPEKNDSLGIHSPVFSTALFNYDFDKYKQSPKGLGDFLDYYIHTGFPLFAHDYLGVFGNRALCVLRLREMPEQDLGKIERFAYRHIYEACKKYGAEMVMLDLGDIHYTQKSHQIFPQGQVRFAEADSMLYAGLQDSAQYEQAYCHWCQVEGKEELVDKHPNVKAHAIIARAILQALKK